MGENDDKGPMKCRRGLIGGNIPPNDTDDGKDWWTKSGITTDKELDALVGELRDAVLPSESSQRNSQEQPRLTSSSRFSAFKRFVDGNVSALADGLSHLPSNIAEIRNQMQREHERLQEEEADISRRWTGSSDSSDHVKLGVQRSTQEEKDEAHAYTVMLLEESLRRNIGVPAEKIVALFSDKESMFGDLDRFANPMLSFGGACYYMPETANNLPSTAAAAWHWRPTSRWLSVDWFRKSPYSPIRLEAHPDLAQSGSKWRAAFEDLMCAALDKPMETREQFGARGPSGCTNSTYYGPGLDWMLSLQCRGILPPLLSRAFNSGQFEARSWRIGVLDAIAETRPTVPWFTEQSVTKRGPFVQDFSELMTEVATEAAPGQESFEDSESVRQYRQELYRVLSLPPSAEPAALSRDAQDSNSNFANKEINAIPSKQFFSGDWERDLVEAGALLQECVETGVADATAMVLNAFREVHGSAEALEKWFGTFPGSASTESPENGLSRTMDIQQGHVPPQYTPKSKLHEEDDDHESNDLALTYSRRQSDESERAYQERSNLALMLGERQEVSPSTPKQPNSPAATQKVDVLSALTTTHTTRLPDGTVTTKVVLKQRFADGREETSESVHTTHEPIERQESEEEKPRTKGWFWS